MPERTANAPDPALATVPDPGPTPDPASARAPEPDQAPTPDPRTPSDRAVSVAAWEALFRAQVTVMRNLNAAFPSDDISFNEYDVCYNLSQQPDRSLRMRDLTGHLLLTQPSISRLVDRLTTRGIVEKLPDPTDARGVIVALTPHGVDLYRSVAVRHAASIAEQLGAGLDDDELRAITALCSKLRVASAATTTGRAARTVTA